MSAKIPDPEEFADFDDAVSVAPNWKLVWWRFKKHRLAFYSSFIVILIVIIAAFPDSINFFESSSVTSI